MVGSSGESGGGRDTGADGRIPRGGRALCRGNVVGCNRVKGRRANSPFCVDRQCPRPVGRKGGRGRRVLPARLTRTLLLADADALFVVLNYFRGNVRGSLPEYYGEFQLRLRDRRAKWLSGAFPDRILLGRLVSHIPWLSGAREKSVGLNIETMSNNTARHHSVPRKGWLKELGLLDLHGRKLTKAGRAVHAGLECGGEYFWLGPTRDTQDEMGIARGLRMGGPFEDTFGVPESSVVTSEIEEERLADDTAAIMRKGYRVAKLIHASQATLVLPIEYIRYRGSVDERRYDWNRIVQRVLVKYRGEFVRLSAKRGRIGFYKWKGRV